MSSDKEILEQLARRAYKESTDFSEDISLVKIGESYWCSYFIPLFLEIVVQSQQGKNTFLKDWREKSPYDKLNEDMFLLYLHKTYKTLIKVINKFSDYKDFDIIVKVCDTFVFESDTYNPIVKDIRVFFEEWRKRPENRSIVEDVFKKMDDGLYFEIWKDE